MHRLPSRAGVLCKQRDLSLSGVGNAASVQTGGLEGTAHNSPPHKTQKNQKPCRIFLPLQQMIEEKPVPAARLLCSQHKFCHGCF